MAVQSIIVEDCSPLIQYAPKGAWQDAQSNDTMASRYSGGSYHLSSTKGATATFKFRGIGFTILGGRRPGYGPFSLSLDGKQLYDGNPLPGSSLLNNTLAVVSGLPDGDHTLILTNSGGAPVDIDTITFETQIGSAGEKPNITTINHTDQRIAYLPATAWKVNTGPVSQNGTLHYSQMANASASVQFSGNAVAFYGSTSPEHADLSVTIDGETVTMPPGSGSQVNTVRTPVLLFWANNLSTGQHRIVVSRLGGNPGPVIDVNSFVVYSSTSDSSLDPSAHSSNTPSIQPSRTTIIAVAAAAGTIALLLLVLCIFLIIRRQRQRSRSGINRLGLSPVTPTLPMQNPAFAFPSLAPLGPVRRSTLDQKRTSKLSVAPSYYDGPESPRGRELFEGRGMTAVASSEWFLFPVPPVMHPTIESTLSAPPVQLQRPLRPPRPPELNIGSLP